MKLAALCYAVLALPASALAQQMSPAVAATNVIGYIDHINVSATSFANATSGIVAGGNFFDTNSGPLYETAIALIGVVTYTMGAELFLSWYPANDTDATDGTDVILDAFLPVLLTINNGIGSLANDKASLIPVNNNPLPSLLDDFSDTCSVSLVGIF